jgi:hypothetical protein
MSKFKTYKTTLAELRKEWESGSADAANYAAIVVHMDTSEQRQYSYGVIFWGSQNATSHVVWIRTDVEAANFKAFYAAELARRQTNQADAKLYRDRMRAQYGITKDAHMHYEVGQIVSGSWGYDQTNVEFYKVVERMGNGGRYRVIKMSCELVSGGEGPMSGRVIPGHDTGDTLIATTTDHGLKIKSLRCALSPWDGHPQYASWYA